VSSKMSVHPASSAFGSTSKSVPSKLGVAPAFDGLIGGMYGAFQDVRSPRTSSNDISLTNVSLVTHTRPVADDGVICKSVKLSSTTGDLRHGEVGVAFDLGFLDSQSGVPLKKLSSRYQWPGRSASRYVVLTQRIKLLAS